MNLWLFINDGFEPTYDIFITELDARAAAAEIMRDELGDYPADDGVTAQDIIDGRVDEVELDGDWIKVLEVKVHP